MPTGDTIILFVGLAICYFINKQHRLEQVLLQQNTRQQQLEKELKKKRNKNNFSQGNVGL